MSNDSNTINGLLCFSLAVVWETGKNERVERTNGCRSKTITNNQQDCCWTWNPVYSFWWWVKVFLLYVRTHECFLISKRWCHSALDLDYSNGTYGALLDLIDKFFDHDYNIEQQMFEECCRYVFGTKAYILYTIDKLVSALIKQVRHTRTPHIHIYIPIVSNVWAILTPLIIFRFKRYRMIPSLLNWSDCSRVIAIWKARHLDFCPFTDWEQRILLGQMKICIESI
jgi:hypothetical protein